MVLKRAKCATPDCEVKTSSGNTCSTCKLKASKVSGFRTPCTTPGCPNMRQKYEFCARCRDTPKGRLVPCTMTGCWRKTLSGTCAACTVRGKPPRLYIAVSVDGNTVNTIQAK